MDRRRVLIVGGGIAGLALAPMLARSGDAVEVIEREPAWRHAGTGMYRPGNAARALRALGLDAQVAARTDWVRAQTHPAITPDTCHRRLGTPSCDCSARTSTPQLPAAPRRALNHRAPISRWTKLLGTADERARYRMTTASTADARRDELIERLFGSALGAMDLLCVYVGDRLGLYGALADTGRRRPPSWRAWRV
jgi:glycine/D-amino acid oxidase-like deaminating enzyme